MGAIPENWERFDDVFSSSGAIPSHCSSDTNRAFDPSKNIRITSMPLVPNRPLSVQRPETSISKIQKFPPPSPLPRAVHAPQRNWKFFVSLVRKPQPEVNQVPEKEERFGKMGNLVSAVEGLARVKKAKAEAFGFLRWSGKVETASSADSEHSKDVNVMSEGLSVEKFKRLVDGAVSDQASSDICLPESTTTDSHFQLSSSATSDLTVLTSNSADTGQMIDSLLANNVVEEERLRRLPLYKKQLEFSKRRNSKLSNLDFEVRLFQKKRSALKLIGRAEEVEEVVPWEPFIPLTNEEEDYVSDALCDFNRRELSVTHESSNIEITREILQCLKPGAWLNDEVINLYLELLKERERRDPKKFLKCHFFNTFFYKKLISGRNGYDYKAVRRWTIQKKIGYGLIECDKIFVPIHKEIHWCLAVINIKDEKFQYLDSLKGMDAQVLKLLARYFSDEVKDKSDKDVHVSSWKKEFVNDLPQQKNGWDCGMFMIKYADFYSRGFKLCFSQEDMPYFRKRTVKEILRLRAD